jgi:hypothetical protein
MLNRKPGARNDRGRERWNSGSIGQQADDLLRTSIAGRHSLPYFKFFWCIMIQPAVAIALSAMELFRRAVSSSRAWTIGIVLVVANASFSLADDEPSTTSKLADVRQTLEAQRDALESLRVRYRYSMRLVGAAEDATKYLHIVALGDETRVYAMKGVKRYYSFSRTDDMNDTEAFVPAVGEMDDSGRPATVRVTPNSVSAYNGTELRQRQSGGVSFSMAHLDPKEPDATYFEASYLGLVSRAPPDITSPTPNLSRAEFRLLDSLVEGRCTLRDGTELVGETPCIVVDWPGAVSSVLWLDPQRGYAIVKRETYYKDNTLLMWRVSVADWIHASDGAWWPRKATAEYFAGPQAPDLLHNVPLVAYDYDVLELDLNDVPDSVFEMDFPEGALVIDMTDGAADPATGRRTGIMKYADPSGKLVDREPAKPPSQPLDAPAAQPPVRSDRKTVIIAANAIVLAALALFIVWRRTRR